MKKSNPLWKKANKLWSEVVKLRAKGICQLCGTRAGTGSHHIIARRFTGTAFLPENGIWTCQVCHNHDDIELSLKCIKIIGTEAHWELYIKSIQPTQLREADLKEIAEQLQKEKDESRNKTEN